MAATACSLVIWALPMALANQDVARFTAPDGMIERLIRAGTT